ncbi:hypothetical protein SBADM41S_07583 [Streptomyces badius]
MDKLLDRLSGKLAMAVVIDEYGGTAGVATLEDIVEEVVGEVRDEHDPHETPDLAAAGEDADGRTLWSADGAARTDQLRRIGLRVPEGPYETLAGLSAAALGGPASGRHRFARHHLAPGSGDAPAAGRRCGPVRRRDGQGLLGHARGRRGPRPGDGVAPGRLPAPS